MTPSKAQQMPRVDAIPHPSPLAGTLVDWRQTLQSHYLRLGRASRQRRFMAVLPDQSLRLIADQAGPEIVLGIKADGRVVGVLEIFVTAHDHAEIGISVEDTYQGRGFGKALFIDGLAAAERIGVRTADLYFASENTGIRHLVRAAGGQIVQSGADCEAHIDISRCHAGACAWHGTARQVSRNCARIPCVDPADTTDVAGTAPAHELLSTRKTRL